MAINGLKSVRVRPTVSFQVPYITVVEGASLSLAIIFNYSAFKNVFEYKKNNSETFFIRNIFKTDEYNFTVIWNSFIVVAFHRMLGGEICLNIISYH